MGSGKSPVKARGKGKGKAEDDSDSPQVLGQLVKFTGEAMKDPFPTETPVFVRVYGAIIVKNPVTKLLASSSNIQGIFQDSAEIMDSQLVAYPSKKKPGALILVVVGYARVSELRKDNVDDEENGEINESRQFPYEKFSKTTVLNLSNIEHPNPIKFETTGSRTLIVVTPYLGGRTHATQFYTLVPPSDSIGELVAFTISREKLATSRVGSEKPRVEL